MSRLLRLGLRTVILGIAISPFACTSLDSLDALQPIAASSPTKPKCVEGQRSTVDCNDDLGRPGKGEALCVDGGVGAVDRCTCVDGASVITKRLCPDTDSPIREVCRAGSWTDERCETRCEQFGHVCGMTTTTSGESKVDCGACTGSLECMNQVKGCEEAGYRDATGLVWRYVTHTSTASDAYNACAKLSETGGITWAQPNRDQVKTLVGPCGGTCDACTGGCTFCIPPGMQEELAAKNHCEALGKLVWVQGGENADFTADGAPGAGIRSAIFCVAPSY